MSSVVVECGAEKQEVFGKIVAALKDPGYMLLDQVFDIEQLQYLFLDIKRRTQEEFHAAGVGREGERQLNPFVRSDRICWVDGSSSQTGFYFQWMEFLRQFVNRSLYLGLFDYECHYAHYRKGAFYKKHLDAFRGSSNRRLTSILYLNPSWQAGDGGELLIYKPDSEEVLERVEPAFGRMVIFLSEEFPHEVLPANKSRYSITGWFRVNEAI